MTATKKNLISENPTLSIFKNAIHKYFDFLKNTDKYVDLFSKSIEISEIGFLLPVSEFHVKNKASIEKLAKWREENNHFFPNPFKVTYEGTKIWASEKLLKIEDRILFFVCANDGTLVGHLGFANCFNENEEMELDNVVRGEKNIHDGIMGAAVLRLIRWANENFSPKQITLRVMKTNIHALNFYEKLGFKKNKEEKINPEKDLSEENTYIRMNYTVNTETYLPNETILTAGPSISSKEVYYVNQAIKYGWNNNWAGYLNSFEKSFAEYLGVENVFATSSCTGAMHIALKSLEIGPGDEVIVPDITWVATANAVTYVGATPIFADVEEDSWCLDPKSFESKITAKTKAVMPVHLYGHPANMEKIMTIAKKHNLYVIEDAAPAIGAKFKDKKVGTFGDFAAFSFQGAKLLVTGEGGMLVVNNKDLLYKAKKIWDQGREPGTFWINEKGLKYKMSNVQAAIGLGQIERADELVRAKRKIFAWYESRLKDIKSIKLNYESSWAQSIYWMTSITLLDNKSISRDDFIKALKLKKIDSRPVFPAISQYPIWEKKQEPSPIAKKIGENSINLPSGVCLKEEEIDYICRSIKEVLGII